MSAPLFTPPVGWQARLAAGEKFNAYELTDGSGYFVALGPISDFMRLATCDWPDDADFIVDALRKAVGQEPCVSPLCEREGDQ